MSSQTTPQDARAGFAYGYLNALSVHQDIDLYKTTSRRLLEDVPEDHLARIDDWVERHGVFPDPSNLTVLTGRAMATSVIGPASVHRDALASELMRDIFHNDGRSFIDALKRKNPDEAIGFVAHALSAMRMVSPETQIVGLQELARSLPDEIQQTRLNGNDRYVTLGFPSLDRMCIGAKKGDTITLVGTSGLGKTWLMVYMAYKAWLAGMKVLFLSMEMQAPEIRNRIVGLDIGVNPRSMALAETTGDEEGRMRLFAGRDDMTDFWLVKKSASVHMESLRGMCERLQPDVVYVDAAYAMPSSKRYNAAHEMHAAREQQFKQLAMDYSIPLIKTTQFNREGAKAYEADEKKRRKRKDAEEGVERRQPPSKSDIMGSAANEHYSSIIIAPEPGDEDARDTSRKVWIIKNRENGPGGAFDCNFLHSPPDFSEIDNTIPGI